jgi:hypothetical protein
LSVIEGRASLGEALMSEGTVQLERYLPVAVVVVPVALFPACMNERDSAGREPIHRKYNTRAQNLVNDIRAELAQSRAS